MKIPTSSSILLATLAISSSSSSCLAAPTGAGTQDTGMASSPSFSTSSASAVYPTGMNAHERSNTIVQRNAGLPVHLESRDDMPPVALKIFDILGNLPILGPILIPLVSALKGVTKVLDVNSSGSGQDLDPQQMAALQNAVDEINRRLNSTVVPSPVGAAAGTVTSSLPNAPAPAAALSDDGDGSGSNSADSTGTSSYAPAPSSTPSAASYGGSSAPDSSANAGGPSASAAPASPVSPGGPPNSPAN